MPMLLKIDALTRHQHYYLSENDQCLFLLTYTQKEGFTNSTNQLIFNFKKSLLFKGTSSWKYKQSAISYIADLLRAIFENAKDVERLTFIPIPPSKCKTDELYDDRLVQVLNAVGGLDVRELIQTKDSITPAHLQEQRPTIQELQDNLIIDKSLISEDIKNIILFDDVITTGAHFIACKNILKEVFPEANIYGIFIARRDIPK